MVHVKSKVVLNVSGTKKNKTKQKTNILINNTIMYLVVIQQYELVYLYSIQVRIHGGGRGGIRDIYFMRSKP